MIAAMISDSAYVLRGMRAAVHAARALGGRTTMFCIMALVPGVDPARAAEPLLPTHGIAMHGALALQPGFTHFPHVNPAAPKGGRMTIGVADSFDTVNPFVPGGSSPPEVRALTFESLLVRSQSERFSLYLLLAERVEVTDDRRQISFDLNPLARFADGKPVTNRDVKFSIETLGRHGFDLYRRVFKTIERIELEGDRTIRIVFNDQSDRETPLLLAMMPILPSHLLTVDQLKNRTMTPLVGSGPYAIASLQPGRQIVYARRPDHWGRDLPVYRGRYNFDEIRVEYVRDPTALFEAFRAGDIDVRFEDNATSWIKGYEFPAARDGRVIRHEIASRLPSGFSAVAFNTRRPKFADVRVREALILAFDAEWLNQNLFHGVYTRAGSLFPRSEFQALGTPATAAERALLTGYPGAVSDGILDGTWQPPRSDGRGQNRDNLAAAIQLFKAAGYTMQGDRLVDARGQALDIEFLAQTPAQERTMLLVKTMWARLGVRLTIRQMDPAQFWERLKSHDYDMVQWTWQPSVSPGNEQLGRWSTASTESNAVLNLTGIRNPAADHVLGQLVAARTADELVTAARALDRVILSGHYVIPLFYAERVWLAHWRHLRYPEARSYAPTETDTWWMEGVK